MKYNRLQIEEYIKSLIIQLDDDPKGNVSKYEEFFKSMDDKTFEDWFDDFLEGKQHLFFIMPNFVKNIPNEKLFKVAEKNNVKLFHRLVFKDNSGREYLSSHEYLILCLPVRRVIQYLDKKYNMPIDDKQISSITGQVMNDSKGAKMSLPQTRLMLAKGLDATIKEFVDLRGGNVRAYQEAVNQMIEYGELRMSDIEKKERARSIDVTSSIFKAMMLDNTI